MLKRTNPRTTKEKRSLLKAKRDVPWELHYDETQHSHYFFNTKTGASEWVEEEEDDEENGIGEWSEVPELEKSKAHSNSNSDEEDDEADDNLLMADADRVFAETNGAVTSFRRCLLVTACLFEGPVTVVESVIRGGCFVFFAIILVLPITCYWEQRGILFSRAKACLREGLLSLAAGLSLLLPCVACMVYRNYDSEADWDLAPIPTVLGWVDTRRFAIFTFGGGSNAQSVGTLREPISLDFRLKDSNDSWRGGILFAPKTIMLGLTSMSKIEAELEVI